MKQYQDELKYIFSSNKGKMVTFSQQISYLKGPIGIPNLVITLSIW
jgi:hypothetical protein